MRSFVILPILLVLSLSPVTAQWTLLNPLPTNNTLNSMVFLNARQGVAVGMNGTILKTTNGGDAWRVVANPSQTHLRSVASPDSSTLFICGDGGLLIRTDFDFSRIDTVETGYDGNLNRLLFLNRSVGFCIGNDRLILKTSDGGSHWSPYRVSWPGDLVHLSFPDDSTGYIAGYHYVPSSSYSGTLLRTRDQGTTWSLVDSLEFQVYALCFTDSLTGFLTNQEIHKTIDGGKTRSATWINPTFLTDMHFRDKQNGLAINYEGYLVRTTDGGETWIPVARNGTSNRILACNSDTLLTYGSGGDIWISRDTGGSWTRSGSGNRSRLADIAFVDERYGFIVGDSVLYRTTDGGSKWIPEYLPVAHVDDADFASRTRGLVLAWNGLWLTEDGCKTWKGSDIRLPRATFGCFYGDERTAWVTGVEYGHFFAYSVIQKSTDGGKTWHPDSLPDYPVIREMYFLPGGTGFALGFQEGLYRTSDTGRSWEMIEGTPVRFAYRKLFFPTNQTGYAIGVYQTEQGAPYNRICKTTDGGYHWTPVHTEDQMFRPEYCGIWFADESTGYVANSEGYILKTTDGGVTWTRDCSSNYLTGLGGSGKEAWAIGEYGTILTTSGVSIVTDSTGQPLDPRSACLIGSVFPNPFLNRTAVTMTLDKEETVTVSVTDFAGHRVGYFAGVCPAGEFTWDFDGSRLGPGVYILTAAAGSEVCSVKIMKITDR